MRPDIADMHADSYYSGYKWETLVVASCMYILSSRTDHVDPCRKGHCSQTSLYPSLMRKTAMVYSLHSLRKAKNCPQPNSSKLPLLKGFRTFHQPALVRPPSHNRPPLSSMDSMSRNDSQPARSAPPTKSETASQVMSNLSFQSATVVAQSHQEGQDGNRTCTGLFSTHLRLMEQGQNPFPTRVFKIYGTSQFKSVDCDSVVTTKEAATLACLFTSRGGKVSTFFSALGTPTVCSVPALPHQPKSVCAIRSTNLPIRTP